MAFFHLFYGIKIKLVKVHSVTGETPIIINGTVNCKKFNAGNEMFMQRRHKYKFCDAKKILLSFQKPSEKEVT
jgi:hypothetical protein